MSRARVLNIASLLILMQTGSCLCRVDELSTLKPAIAVEPTPIEFGFRRVGVDAALEAELINPGTAPLIVSRIALDPPDAPFRVETGPEFSLTDPVAENARVPFRVIFTPPARQDYEAKLIFENNVEAQPPYEVILRGTGGPPRIRVLPESVNFDLVNQGTPAVREVLISNVGLDDLHVTEVKLDPSSNPGFQLAMTDNFGSGIIPVEQNARVRIEMAPTITGTATGTLHILSDADGEPDKTVPITATANLAPVVDLVEKVTRQSDYRTDIYLEVTLDASSVMDPEGDTFTMPDPGAPGNTWRIVERPTGSQAILEPTGLPREGKIYIDQVGVYRVEVTATDSRGATATATATIRAIRDLALRLTWEPDPNSPCHTASMPEATCGRTDVDLHLVAPGGMIGDYFAACDMQAGCNARCSPVMAGAMCKSQGLDVAYANRNPDWGMIGNPDDDPSLDIDDAYGYGPENISMNSPVAGDYLVYVHFCNDRLTHEGAVAQVEVFFHGEPAPTPVLGPVALPQEGSQWLAGIVHYNPTGNPKFTLTHFNNSSPPIVDAAANLCTQ